ncbi:glycosyltransferase family 25 protein [Volucribacter amazonae]|uniref:Lsg locus protein 4 n=1 Tax=Volucribacter amazonae TaxID=256731 RepID=A0A9X4SIW9_9PAST|nr:glycosyltransferase family 25 protein [Volucribacter amazonae]MDG6896130.1 Lsg locus protein 4 [Volucribacter amazonae]
MKKFLISLAKDSQRRQLFFAQADSQDVEIFSAVNMLDQSLQDLTSVFEQEKFRQRYQREVSRGEIGCTLSHLAVYQKICQDQQIDEQEFVLICEDDALWADNFAQYLNQIEQQQIETDILLLGQSKIASFNDKELEINYPTTLQCWRKPIMNSHYAYSYPYKNYFAGTVAYLIKKSACQRILQLCEQQPPYWLADDYPFFAQQGHIDVMLVRPLLCIENPQLASNLAPERQALDHHLLLKLAKYPLKKVMALWRNWRV